jgi:hypothetical protein
VLGASFGGEPSVHLDSHGIHHLPQPPHRGLAPFLQLREHAHLSTASSGSSLSSPPPLPPPSPSPQSPPITHAIRIRRRLASLLRLSPKPRRFDMHSHTQTYPPHTLTVFKHSKRRLCRVSLLRKIETVRQ